MPSEEPSPDQGPAKFGQSFTYEDGLKVTVTEVKRGTVNSDDWEGNPGDPKVIVTVKITNGTTHKVRADEAGVQLYYGSQGDVAENLYNYEGFTGTISKGRSRTGKYDFALPNKTALKSITVEVEPSFDHESAIFEGSVK